MDAATRFRALFEAHYPRVRRFAHHRALVGADADDLVAEVFTVAWRRLDDVPADDALPWLLAVAGTDTTRNQLAASVHVLCDHPDQWALLGRHPELATNAVEETMRHSPVAFAALRIALADVELAGVVPGRWRAHAVVNGTASS